MSEIQLADSTKERGSLEGCDAGLVIVSPAVLRLIKQPAVLLGFGSCPELAL